MTREDSIRKKAVRKWLRKPLVIAANCVVRIIDGIGDAYTRWQIRRRRR